MKTTTQNTFILYDSKDRRFSFHAKDIHEAERKMIAWCRYQSFPTDGFVVRGTSEEQPFDLHNEYVEDL